jgi:hypothetical protein
MKFVVNPTYLECVCESSDHVLRVYPDSLGEEGAFTGLLSVDYCLPNGMGFWIRLKRAWKYLWGQNTCVADVYLDSDQVAQLQKVIAEYNTKLGKQAV